VGPAAGGDHLHHGARASQARLGRAQVDEELVLEGALDGVGVAEVLDPRAARGEAGGGRLGSARASLGG
jgi:hypothetical protein